jgi:indolepyruvate ferredoxin oxidoreductase beta subunit
VKSDILITGVGGQGILLTSMILGRAAIKAGMRVRSSETHGMAQRGGSVVSHVRIGDVYSPLIPMGGADFMIAFEPLEAIRNADFLKDGGTIVMNMHAIKPTGSKKKIGSYPPVEDTLMALLEFSNTIPIEAAELAEEAGNPLTLNIVLLGAATALEGFPISERGMREMIKGSVPKKALKANIMAFGLGLGEVREHYL